MPIDFIKAYFESSGSSSFNTTANKTFYIEEEVGKDAPEVGTPFSFSYGNNKQSANASTTNGPLGDPRWAIIVTDIDQKISSANIFVFPNPVTDFLNIRFINRASAKINMYDMEGRTIYFNHKFQSVNAGETIQISMQNLPKGNYMYSVEMIENGQLNRVNGKIVK
jgi:hypothetical protein